MCANTPTPTRPRKATRTSTQFDQLFKLSTKKDNAARDDKVHFCFRGWKLNWNGHTNKYRHQIHHMQLTNVLPPCPPCFNVACRQGGSWLWGFTFISIAKPFWQSTTLIRGDTGGSCRTESQTSTHGFLLVNVSLLFPSPVTQQVQDSRSKDLGDTDIHVCMYI